MPTLQLVVESRHFADEQARSCLDPLEPFFADRMLLFGLADGGAAALLRDLAFACCELLADRRQRIVVPTEAISPGEGGRRGPVWEVGLERDGPELLVSLFCQGSSALVAQCERRVPVETARAALVEAIGCFSVQDRGLAMAREALLTAPVAPGRGAPRRQTQVRGSSGPLRLESSVVLRTGGRLSGDGEVARADLHALLCPGALELRVGACTRRVASVHTFLVAEQLIGLVEVGLQAVEGGPGMLRRAEGGGVVLGLQVDARGRAVLSVAPSGEEASAERLPPVPMVDVARTVVAWSRRLLKSVIKAEAGQRNNLRLQRLRRRLRDLVDRMRTLEGGDDLPPSSQLHGTPASYQAYAESHPPPPVTDRGASGKLRFEESWRADVPNLDLRSIFVAGDRLVAGSARELACIERRTGELLWTQQTRRAVSVMTPAGVVRLAADGHLALHDLRDGEMVLELQLEPCVGASASGAVVAAPGLPCMVLLAEGARHLVAVDLDSNEVRWRRVVRTRGGGAPKLRLRRAGKLVVVSDGREALAALDLLTGEVVWRHAGPRGHSHLLVDRGELYGLVHDPRRIGPTVVERLDPWTGERVWRTLLPRRIVPGGGLQPTRDALIITTRDDERTGAVALDRENGSVRFDQRGGLCGGRAACITIDDVLVANSDRGELVALGDDGDVRYRHVFASLQHLHPADQPRSLAPVLRSGALFLPQSEVYVVRPRDGAMLGRLPCDLIPDALRVDEQCGAYVAEASGYLAAYHASAMLTLVRVE